jgi:hypothetical protein
VKTVHVCIGEMRIVEEENPNIGAAGLECVHC